MNDLNQISRQNAKAIVSNIPGLIAKGHWVVVEYAGLHVVGCENFSGEGAEQRANDKLAELNGPDTGASTHGELFPPKGHGGGSGGIARRQPASGLMEYDSANADHLAQRFGAAV